MQRTDQPTPQTTPVSEDADATAAQLHQRADADYAAGAGARNDLDEHVRRYGAFDASN